MIEKALDKISSQCDGAEIFKIKSSGSTIKTKKFNIDSFKERNSIGYGIRILKDNRMGFYFSNTLNEDALNIALNIASVAERDKHQNFPGVQQYGNANTDIDIMTVEEGIDMAESMLHASKEFNNVHPTTGTISWDSSVVTIGNTNGIYRTKSEFTLSAYIGTVAKEVEPATGFHFEVSRKKDIDPSVVGATASNLARRSINPVRLDTAKMPVIFRPMAVTELLEHTLIPSFSADNVQRGRSKLKDRMGDDIFGEISIHDDGTMRNGLLTEAFDDEGVASQRTCLVDKGFIKGFLYDTYTANKENLKSTGNAGRSSHSSLPGVSPSNFILSSKDTVEDNETGALIVNGLVGAHTANPISGDFSCETRNAFLDGVPVKKAIVSGNVFDLLSAGVGLGSDYEQYSSIHSPSIIMNDLMVIG